MYGSIFTFSSKAYLIKRFFYIKRQKELTLRGVVLNPAQVNRRAEISLLCTPWLKLPFLFTTGLPKDSYRSVAVLGLPYVRIPGGHIFFTTPHLFRGKIGFNIRMFD